MLSNKNIHIDIKSQARPDVILDFTQESPLMFNKIIDKD